MFYSKEEIKSYQNNHPNKSFKDYYKVSFLSDKDMNKTINNLKVDLNKKNKFINFQESFSKKCLLGKLITDPNFKTMHTTNESYQTPSHSDNMEYNQYNLTELPIKINNDNFPINTHNEEEYVDNKVNDLKEMEFKEAESRYSKHTKKSIKSGKTNKTDKTDKTDKTGKSIKSVKSRNDIKHSSESILFGNENSSRVDKDKNREYFREFTQSPMPRSKKIHKSYINENMSIGDRKLYNKIFDTKKREIAMGFVHYKSSNYPNIEEKKKDYDFIINDIKEKMFFMKSVLDYVNPKIKRELLKQEQIHLQKKIAKKNDNTNIYGSDINNSILNTKISTDHKFDFKTKMTSPNFYPNAPSKNTEKNKILTKMPTIKSAIRSYNNDNFNDNNSYSNQNIKGINAIKSANSSKLSFQSFKLND